LGNLAIIAGLVLASGGVSSSLWLLFLIGAINSGLFAFRPGLYLTILVSAGVMVASAALAQALNGPTLATIGARLIALTMVSVAVEHAILLERTQQQAIRHLATRMDNLVAQATDLIFTLDTAGRITWVNQAVCAATGYSPDELLGKPAVEFVPAEVRTAVQEVLGKILSGEAVEQLEVEVLAKDGRRILLEVRGRTIYEGGRPVETFHIARDITERRKTEQRLAQLSRVVEQTADAVVITNREGIIEYVNPAFEALTGYTPREAVGQTLRIVKSGQHDQAFYERLWETILSGRTFRGIFVNRAKNGELYYEDKTITPLRDAHGNITHFVSTGKDITEGKKAEEQIRSQFAALSLLMQAAERMTIRQDMVALCQEICNAVVDGFGLRLAWIGRAEPDGRVRPLAWAGDTADYLKDVEIRWDDSPLGQGPTGRAIRDGRPVIFNDLAGEEGFAPWRPAALARGYRASAAFPLISEGRPFGSLNIYSDQPGFFTPERVDILQSYSHIAATGLESARLLAEARRSVQRLTALRSIDMAITASLDLRVTLTVILDQITTQLGVDAAAVLLLNPYTQTLEYAAGSGFRTRFIERSRVRLGEGHAGRAALERRIIHILNLSETGSAFERAQLLAGEGFVAYYAVPLVAKGQVKGVLDIFHRQPLEPDEEWVDFLETLAGQAAVAIDNAALFDGLQRSHIELALAYDTTLEGWTRALDLRDKETEGHTQRVTQMTLRLARAMGIPESELPHIYRGALLHDIGKMGIPDSILLKPGPLTPEEWEVMRRHPVYAYELLSPIAYLKPSLDIPYCHHEKWDGSGYPRGLKGEEIPLAARIFSVVDVWDALRSARPYRPAWPEEKVVEYIREQAGKHFDPRVVDTFLSIVLEGWRPGDH